MDKATLDDKIEIYKGYMNRIFDISDRLLNEPNGHIAIPFLTFHYFENISKMKAGFTRVEVNNRIYQKSKEFFEKGFRELFPMGTWGSDLVGNSIDIWYRKGRCGLYHAGVIQGNFFTKIHPGKYILDVDKTDRQNPKMLVDWIGYLYLMRKHFNKYMQELENKENEDLRRNFLTRFDYIIELPDNDLYDD